VNLEAFLLPYAIIFGTAAVLFGAWWTIRRLLAGTAKGIAGRTIDEVRRRNPPATVAHDANAWSCLNCRSVNRPDAVVCYRCRGDRAEVEGFEGRI
jgi:hypothetical protein